MVSQNDLEKLFFDKVIAITGGVGSIGSEIVKKILTFKIKKLIIIDNRETEMFYLKSLFNTTSTFDTRVDFKFGDVRNTRRVNEVLRGVDIVFHAAAMKHVIMSEENPYEAINTNIMGTRNVVDSCLLNEVERMIFISTDKAANPQNVMGTTKLLAEKLISAVASSQRRVKTKFGIVRFGNVLYSRGSVLEIWKKQIKEKGDVTLTNPEMSRFFMSIPQSVNLIFSATFYANMGEIFIFKMPSVFMKDFFNVYCELNNIPEEKIKIIGVRKGEKLHEELLGSGEDAYLFENDFMFAKIPTFSNKDEIKDIESKGFNRSLKKDFTSNDEENLLDKEKITSILKNYLH